MSAEYMECPCCETPLGWCKGGCGALLPDDEEYCSDCLDRCALLLCGWEDAQPLNAELSVREKARAFDRMRDAIARQKLEVSA